MNEHEKEQLWKTCATDNPWQPVVTRLPDTCGVVKDNADCVNPLPAPTKNDILSQYIIKGLQIHNLHLFGCWFERGWKYDYRGRGLKKYVFKHNHTVREVWAPDEKRLRESIKGHVDYVLEIPQENW